MSNYIHTINENTNFVSSLNASGQKVFLRKGQEIGGSPDQKKFISYVTPPSVVPSDYLSTGGGQITFSVNTADFQTVSRVFVQFQIEVKSAVRLLPAFYWIYRIDNYKDDSPNVGQTVYDIPLMTHFNNMLPSQFSQIGSQMLTDPTDCYTSYYIQPTSPNVMTVYVPLYDANLLSYGYVKEYPQFMRIVLTAPARGCVEAGVKSDVVLNQCRLIIQESKLGFGKDQAVQRVFRENPVIKPCLTYLYNALDITIGTASTPTTVTLSGLKGLSPFMIFGLQKPADYWNPVGGASKRYVPIGTPISAGSASVLTSSGNTIFGVPQDINFNQKMITSEATFGDFIDRGYPGLNFIDYGNDRLRSINGVMAAGYRYAAENEQLQIIPGYYSAEAPRVVTFLTNSAVAAATPLVATGGYYQLVYTDGDAKSFMSAPISATASQAVVQAAIDAMQIVGSSTVTAGATNLNNAAGLTLTVTNLTELDVAIKGARWSMINLSLQNTTAGTTNPLNISVTDSGGTIGQGIPPGQYKLICWMATFMIFTVQNRSSIITNLPYTNPT